ncbi:unnamed protein product [Adineta steineri]|uniref:G-protein coupled receptors family 1 profile domain-containing protein n=1 Tax=Adineta steineri TaxID=433720 RepID=A0A818UKC5_9BILA|nr:unnamed protein product [Adineta steineri]CAF3699859.1 unnamed protein product [Adineta steineri]
MNNTTMNSTNIEIDINNNQIYLIGLINYLNKTISQFGLGIIWIVGNIGSIFTCIVFSQPAFHKSPCAMYFFASSFSQFFVFNFALLTRMLQFGYNIQIVNTVFWFCKIRYYLFYVFVAVSRYNIILASIDRYFASSREALRRQWSSPKIALRLIISNVLLWIIIYSQVLIFYDIHNGNCSPQPGSYGTFFSIYISIDSGILPLSIMLIFGLLTVNNVRQNKRLIKPSIANIYDGPVRVSRVSKKDTQLYRMLANQILLFIVLNIFNPCYLLYQASTIYTLKSPLRRAVELFINNASYILIYLGFALTFTNFIVSSGMFRREFQQFIQTKILRRPPLNITPVETPVRSVSTSDARNRNNLNKEKL